MVLSNLRAIVIVFALVLLMGVVTGCKQKTQNSWVNTNSMPGQTFSKYTPNKNNAQNGSSTVIYLGADKDASSANFGPRDVSFNFRDLK